jgi:hypothetical protein
VNLSGTWAICGDCRDGGVCDPLAAPILVDEWAITQAGPRLVIDSQVFPAIFSGPATLSGP